MAILMRAQLIATLAALAIGAVLWLSPSRAFAPEAAFRTLSGETFSTSQLRGKVVLVHFWATWCPDCLREMPKLLANYRRYAPRGYEVVAVAVKSSPEQVQAFADRRALPFRIVLDEDGALARTFGKVHVTPTSWLIGKDGRVLRRYVGEANWAELDASVEKALSP